MTYELLALDVDGTLVGPDSRVPAETVRAIGRARRAGLKVCLATGRSYIETIDVWRQLQLEPPYEPMILIGGALVAEPHTGRTLYHKPVEPDLAESFADALTRRGYCTMAIVDAWRHGVDYILAGPDDIHSASQKWFSQMNVKTRRVEKLHGIEDLPEMLRLSTVVDADKADGLAGELAEEFAGRLNCHAIVAPNYGITIVEAFSLGCDKFRALQYVGQTHRIGPGSMIAVGDDVNDLAMIRGAGLGVAVSHAQQVVKHQADRVLDEPVSDFINRLAEERAE